MGFVTTYDRNIWQYEIMGYERELPEWQPLLDLYRTMSEELIKRAERATRHAGFALPLDKALDLRCIYPEPLEATIEQDTTLQAIQAQPISHAYEAEERAERIRTRRTVIALSALLWHDNIPRDNPPADQPRQTAA